MVDPRRLENNLMLKVQYLKRKEKNLAERLENREGRLEKGKEKRRVNLPLPSVKELYGPTETEGAGQPGEWFSLEFSQLEGPRCSISHSHSTRHWVQL